MSDVSIALKLTGNMSEALNEIKNGMTPFRREIGDLQKELDVLNATKIDLKVDVDKAKRKLAAAKKAFYDLGEEARDDTPVREAQANYEALAEKLDLVSKQAKQAEKDMRSAADVESRVDNRAAARSSGPSLLEGMGQAGLYDMLGSTLSEGANALVGSAFGAEVGGLFSSALGGAGTGAAIGSMIAPGVGTAVGAALGGIVGLVGGATQNFEQQDEAFKGYYKDQYDQAEAERARMTASGSAIDSQRAGDLRVFSTLLDDNAQAAGRFQGSLIELGRTPPFSYNTVAQLSKDMLGLGLSTDDALSRINSLAEAAAALNLSESSVSSVVSYLESAQLAGKLDTRVVKSLSKLGVNAYEALAEEFGINQEDVMERLGALDVDRAIQAIYDYMGTQFAGASGGLTDTFAGASGILDSYREDLDAAKGEGYNDTRKSALEEEIAYLDGPMGDRMKEAYRQMGEWEASIENEGEALQRKVMEAVMTGSVPQDMSEAAQRQLEEIIELYNQGGEASGQALARAQTLAANLYYESEGYQELLGYQKSLAGGLREDAEVVGSWRDAGYSLGQEFTKGMADAWRVGVEERAMALGNSYAAVYGGRYGAPEPEGSHAAGLRRVPYDGYLALLHQDERVLTASEARAGEAGGGGIQVSITGNEFHIRQESDVDAVAEALVERIRLARLAGVME